MVNYFQHTLAHVLPSSSYPRMLAGRPNTYSFTKALAESLLAEEAADLPVAIVRPSIGRTIYADLAADTCDAATRGYPFQTPFKNWSPICGTVAWAWRHPCTGWVDSLNGVVGPFTAILTGTLRSVHSDPAVRADIVPVDLVVNLVLAVGWNTARSPSECGEEDIISIILIFLLNFTHLCKVCQLQNLLLMS